MKMFSKIMLVSLLTVCCMPTTQVRADWKSATGVGCYVASGLAGALTLLLGWDSCKMNALMTDVSEKLIKIEKAIEKLDENASQRKIQAINNAILSLPRYKELTIAELANSADEGLTRQGLVEWAKKAKQYREESDDALNLKQTKRNFIVSTAVALSSLGLGYALRNWIK